MRIASSVLELMKAMIKAAENIAGPTCVGRVAMVWVAALLLTLLPTPAAWAGYGTVELVSEPPGATVYVDGKLVAGSTPARVTVPAGLRHFELISEGYRKFEFQLFLTSGVNLSKSLTLVPDRMPSPPATAKKRARGARKGPQKSKPPASAYEFRTEKFKAYLVEKTEKLNAIEGKPIFAAGHLILDKAGYDFESGRLPVRVNAEKWAKSLVGVEKSFVYVERDALRGLFNAELQHPVYIAFSQDGDVEHAFMVLADRPFYLMGVGRFKSPAPDMKFVAMAQGCFTMGSARGDSDEKPEHKVCLDDYWIGKYEVTQGQWMELMGGNPSRFRRGKDHPVERVSWNDVQKFIKKLNSRGGLTYRLPTEAEWEYANQGGHGGLYPWGDRKPECRRSVANGAKFDDNGSCNDTGTNYVGRYAANFFGLHDMAGNVREWVQDWYGSGYYGVSHGLQNPTGPINGSSRVLRGGGWSEPAALLRSTLRSYNAPDFSYDDLGFRLVMIPNVQ